MLEHITEVTREHLRQERANGAPVFVHSDLFHTRQLAPQSKRRREILSGHMKAVLSIIGNRPLWMPTFNYDFTDTQVFSVADDKSQVGPLTEHFRLSVAGWRTPVPVFSVSGTLQRPDIATRGTIDPFSDDSIFGLLCRLDGHIVLYGAALSSLTFIHHAERAAGGPLYRYDKTFVGRVIHPDDTETSVTLLYHVRPRGRQLEYDWDKLVTSFRDNGLMQEVGADGARVSILRCKPLRDYLVSQIRRDPLFLLTDQTRSWVERDLRRNGGRRFQLADFEQGLS